jgi:hypothetical protein
MELATAGTKWHEVALFIGHVFFINNYKAARRAHQRLVWSQAVCAYQYALYSDLLDRAGPYLSEQATPIIAVSHT